MLVANFYFVAGWLRAVVTKFLIRLLVKLKIRKTSDQVRPDAQFSSQVSMDKHPSHSSSIRVTPGVSRSELVQPSNTSIVPDEQQSVMDETVKEGGKLSEDKK